jgi:hypothetical protein
MHRFLVADVLELLHRHAGRLVRRALDHQGIVEPRSAALEREALAELVHQDRRHPGLLGLGKRAHRFGFLRVFEPDFRELALVAALGPRELGVLQHFFAAVIGALNSAVIHPYLGHRLHDVSFMRP